MTEPRGVRWAAAALLGVAVAFYGLTPLSDYDLWWHLATGREMLATGSLLPTDPFSYTHGGRPWPYKDGGAALAMFLLYEGVGPGAVLALKVLCLAAGAAGFAWLARLRGAPVALVAVLVALAVTAVAFRFTERPAIFSFTATVAALVLLERHRAGVGGRAELVALVPLTAVAANLHRGTLFVPFLVGAYALADTIERRRGATLRRPAAAPLPEHGGATYEQHDRAANPVGGLGPWLAAAGCAAASLATPFGWASIARSLSIMGSTSAADVAAFRGSIPEWQATSWENLWAASPATGAIGACLVAAWALAARKWPQVKGPQVTRPQVWDVVLTVLAVGMGLQGVRFLPYFVLLALPPCASMLGEALGEVWRGRVRNVVALGAAAAAAVAALGTGSLEGVRSPLAPHHFPSEAVAFVRSQLRSGALSGRVLNEFHLGGYLLYHTWPDVPLYVDGRNDLVFDAAFMAGYRNLLEDRDLLASEVSRWQVEWLFLDNRSPSPERAHLDRDWSLVFASRTGLVYVRPGGANAELARTLGYRYLQAHRPSQSLVEAWASDGGAHRAEVLAEARRMVADDPANIGAQLALAEALRLDGRLAGELDRVLDALVELGLGYD